MNLTSFLVALGVLAGTGLTVLMSPYFGLLFVAIGAFIALTMLRH